MFDATEFVDEAVLVRFRQGDQQAVGSLLEKLQPYVRVIVRTAIGGRPAGVAESDLIQDVMLQAVRSNGTFRGESYGEFVCWMRTIAVRTSRQALQRAGGRQPSQLVGDLAQAVAVDDGPTAEAGLLDQENAAFMASALQRLPDDMRSVLLLRLVEGLGHAQVAEHLGRSPGATRMLFLRAVERLRDECGNPGRGV
jgi:RNA polymerase sigma-70 factor (ECF subfamily)